MTQSRIIAELQEALTRAEMEPDPVGRFALNVHLGATLRIHAQALIDIAEAAEVVLNDGGPGAPHQDAMDLLAAAYSRLAP